MPYELIKKTVVRVENRPSPCDYCTHGSGGATNTDGSIDDRACFCEIYRSWLEGAIVIPEGFDEVREVH